jgi:protein subunit release factor B
MAAKKPPTEKEKDGNEKRLLFTITAADCEWSYTKGTGAGGQKRNKTSSAVHCTHKESGAHGYAEDSRSQLDNKRLAFQRMAETDRFKKWHQLEVMKRLGTLSQIDQYVEQQLKNVQVEIRVDGKWQQVDRNAPLDTGEDNE